MPNISTAISFLEEVWKKQCRTGDYVFLSSNNPKKEKSWKDHPFKYERDMKSKLEKFFRKYPTETHDLYFCVLPFADTKRDKTKVKRTKFLWQDLDFADPYKFPDELKPTHFWESSPGRYHGLWELSNKVHSNRITEVESLNRDLAYKLDADHGGWDLGQVLRIPGTLNHKYPEKPEVKQKKSKISPYEFIDLRDRVPHQPKPLSEEKMVPLEEGDARMILAKWKAKMPRDLLTLLLQKKVPVGERSEKIWFISSSLYEMGLNPSEIFTLVKNSAWNKYRGRDDENVRLQTELEKITTKAVEQVEISIKDGSVAEGSEYEYDGMSLKVESYQDVMGSLSAQPGWLVEGFWARRSHGIVAGEPKTFKSTYVMDLAISVASGKPFLGKYPVLEKGPVIYVQNENADWIIKDRMQKIINHRELIGKVVQHKNGKKLNVTFPQDLPLYFINQQNYMLNDPIHQEILEGLIEEVKPVLIIFDPLYLMFDGDLNSAKDLGPVLSYLLNLKNKYRTGVIAIHHYNKSQVNVRGGQKMLGSAILHGFTESSWFLRRKVEDQDIPEDWANKTEEEIKDLTAGKQTEPATIIMEREFRSAGPGPALELSLTLGDTGEDLYEISIDFHRPESDGKKKEFVKMEDLVYDRLSDYLESRSNADSTTFVKKDLVDMVNADKEIGKRKVRWAAIKEVIMEHPSSFEFEDLGKNKVRLTYLS